MQLAKWVVSCSKVQNTPLWDMIWKALPSPVLLDEYCIYG